MRVNSKYYLLRLAIYVGHFILFTLIVPLLLINLSGLLRDLMEMPNIGLGYLNLIIGLILMALGLIILLMAEVDMYNHSGGGTPIPFYNPPEDLVENGVYGCTRNPMYLGTTLEYIGVGVLIGDLGVIILSFIILSIALTLYLTYEAPQLEERFGERFKRYAEETPLLIPRPRCIYKRLKTVVYKK